MRRKVIAVLTVVMLCICMLAACGKSDSPFVGTYGGSSTSGSKVTIVIKSDNTCTYSEKAYNNKTFEGTWEAYGENSITMEFGGKVSKNSEPLICSLSADGSELYVDSDYMDWNKDTYTRR